MRLPYLPDFHEEHCLDHIPFPFQLIKRGSIGRHVLILNIHCDKGVSDYLFSMQLICLSFFRATFLRNEKSRVGLMVRTAHKLYYITLFVKCNIKFVRSFVVDLVYYHQVEMLVLRLKPLSLCIALNLTKELETFVDCMIVK